MNQKWSTYISTIQKRTLTIILIFISTLGFSQGNSETVIFKKIIDQEIGKGTTGIYIQCEKAKTTFELKDFNKNTGLEVPENILREIEKNGIKSTDGTWDSDLIKGLNYGSDFIKNTNCLTNKDAELLFEKTKNRQNIVSISEPVFDNNYENCVVSITYWKFNGSAYGHKYFLKKVYGVWTVVIEYEQWMT